MSGGRRHTVGARSRSIVGSSIAKRICVVGCSGAGKSTFARRCAALGYAHLELDGLLHQAGWTKLPDAEIRARIEEFIATHERWVIDGNYAAFRELLWGHADMVVWLDVSRATVMVGVTWRSLSRWVRRDVLWNGNRERLREILSFDPDRSVVAWAWARFDHYRDMYERATRSREHSHLRWVRLRSRAEVKELLARASRLGGVAC